jgi:hypothetical protein
MGRGTGFFCVVLFGPLLAKVRIKFYDLKNSVAGPKIFLSDLAPRIRKFGLRLRFQFRMYFILQHISYEQENIFFLLISTKKGN